MLSLALFKNVYDCLLETNPTNKVAKVRALHQALLNDKLIFDEDCPLFPVTQPGFPATLELVAPKDVPRRRLHSLDGRAAMLHAVLHIEFNAINLALDAIYRFREMPVAYYLDWCRVACEEAYHYSLLAQHLASLGYQYGDFPAHLGLWEMAQKTSDTVLARMALVPRLLEARGLDVAPDMARRLKKAGDETAYQIIGIIFQDEIFHVQVGNHWYYTICQQKNLDPMATFVSLLEERAPDYLRGPLALSVRKKAGFKEADLVILNQLLLRMKEHSIEPANENPFRLS